MTGAGGSVGTELSRQLLDAGPERLVLLGHGEHSLFTLQQELAPRAAPGVLETVVADIRHGSRIGRILREERPDLVLHAAAHKHVPLMEHNVAEAITNNVLGTWVVLEAVTAVPSCALLLLSTDKAVRPASVMGATKQLAEGLVRHMAWVEGRRYAAIRFGNVLGSRGSVVPILAEQIRCGGPVTLTHPGMRRYFLGPDEAARLVLEAALLMEGGELFATVMGEPVSITELAERMIRTAGLEPGKDVAIEFRGIRPGEKVDEEPFFAAASTDPTDHPRLRLSRDPVPSAEWVAALRVLAEAAWAEAEEGRLLGELRRLCPDFAAVGG
ncbi:MAG TPA: polysaccharide biosynthesis protein [Gemmatimonadales bacterium]|nr:polysaccharide biosynthesis protein [Gemmatimonadales bacterium]